MGIVPKGESHDLASYSNLVIECVMIDELSHVSIFAFLKWSVDGKRGQLHGLFYN